MCIEASKWKKDWRNFQQLRRLYGCSVEWRGWWYAALPVGCCRRLPRPLGPGQLCRKGGLERWTSVPSPKAHLQKLEWGSQRAEVLAEFGKAVTVWKEWIGIFQPENFWPALPQKALVLFYLWSRKAAKSPLSGITLKSLDILVSVWASKPLEVEYDKVV